MLGTKETEGKTNPVVWKMEDGSFLLGVWTSQKNLDDWLAVRETRPAYFDTDVLRAFGGFFGVKVPLSLLVDPPSDLNPYDSSFSLGSIPADRIMKPQSVVESWNILARQLRAEQASPEKIELIRKFSVEHPEIRAGQLLPRFSESLRTRTNLMQLTGLEIREARLRAQAVSFARGLYLSIWDTHDELRLISLVEYTTATLGKTVRELKTEGDFDAVWQYVESELKLSGLSVDRCLRAREIAEQYEHLTCSQAVAVCQKALAVFEPVATMSGQEFERLVADIFVKKGFHVDSTKASHDGGIDLIAHCDIPLHQGKYIIQCKRYDGSVGEPYIRDLYGVMISERATREFS